MWLEYELLTRPDLAGCYCLSTSYRQEQNPTEGRHELIFPMFEFEAPGDFEDLLKMENDLCKHLGFKAKTERNRYTEDFPGGMYQSVLAKYTGAELDAGHEEEMYQEYGDVFFLTHFPESTSPFWNMKLGEMDTELFKEWFQAFSQAAGITLHVENIYGDNSHHIIESCFKGLARSLRAALEKDPRNKNTIPSTKGSL